MGLMEGKWRKMRKKYEASLLRSGSTITLTIPTTRFLSHFLSVVVCPAQTAQIDLSAYERVCPNFLAKHMPEVRKTTEIKYLVDAQIPDMKIVTNNDNSSYNFRDRTGFMQALFFCNAISCFRLILQWILYVNPLIAWRFGRCLQKTT